MLLLKNYSLVRIIEVQQVQWVINFWIGTFSPVILRKSEKILPDCLISSYCFASTGVLELYFEF